MANTNASNPQHPMSEKPSFSDKPQGVAEKSRNLGQAASDLASSVGQKASDMASNVGKKASDAAASVGEKADDATSAVGSGMKSLAGSIREKTPESGMIGGVTGAVADTLERGGDYLQDRQLSGIAEDVTDIVRRHPLPAIFIGVGLGFVLARMTMSSRS
jgi:ElaB/YqjD/DUF883 family membrane-anchored ribosome-binding protein